MIGLTAAEAVSGGAVGPESLVPLANSRSYFVTWLLEPDRHIQQDGLRLEDFP